jgi:cyclopropane-fatty-acyl-phospholipid synthase
MNMTTLGISAVERGWVPDALVRIGIRHLCRERLRQLQYLANGFAYPNHTAFIASLRSGPIAIDPEMANQQHYELPPEFFAVILGPRLKYSCCYFPSSTTTLAEAEEAALALTCQRAEIADDQQILELGCGWGSLTLWIAERYPRSQITAITNSAAQQQYVEAVARSRGLVNVCVVKCDINAFSPKKQMFDRVVSVEMFEHTRNYDCLLRRIASWLRPGGKVFVHMFCHAHHAYPFETGGAANWMGRYFFTGGMMPSANLLRQFEDFLVVTKHEMWSGRHYQRTAEAWLTNLDNQSDNVLKIFSEVYGPTQASCWRNRWRMFLLAVAELFGFANGQEWFVSHYVMEHRANVSSELRHTAS